MAGEDEANLCYIFLHPAAAPLFMLCCWRKYRAARDYISNDKVTNAMASLAIRYTHIHTHTIADYVKKKKTP